MSVTTTTNPVTTNLFRTLQDYEIHESAEQSPQEHPAPTNPNAPPAVANPVDWTDDYNNVPNYRPIDYQQDLALRPGGMNPAETSELKIPYMRGDKTLMGDCSVYILDDERCGIQRGKPMRALLDNADRNLTVVLLQGVAQLWRKTFGRLNPNIFRYAVGGEW